jgi:transposase
MAVANRMIRIIFIVLSRKEPYKDPHINYEELVVRRNAPRWIEALVKYGYLTRPRR